MNLPKYHETFYAILTVLSDRQIIHYKELDILVRDKFYSNLPQELLEQTTSSGANTLFDRIEWGKSYLKQGKFVSYPQRGMVQITEKGLNQFKKGSLTLRELHNDNDFSEYFTKYRNTTIEKQKNSEIIESSDNLFDNASPQDLIDSGINTIENQVKNDLLEKLKTINPYYFEKVILLLLKKMGYGDMIETSKSGDGGVDGIINEDKLGLEKIYIQAKRYADSKVREPEIRNFIGAMNADTDKGVFVTTSTFDDGAVQKARDARHTIVLINGSQLVNLMYEYGIGVQVRQTHEVKGLDEDFFD